MRTSIGPLAETNHRRPSASSLRSIGKEAGSSRKNHQNVKKYEKLLKKLRFQNSSSSHLLNQVFCLRNPLSPLSRPLELLPSPHLPVSVTAAVFPMAIHGLSGRNASPRGSVCVEGLWGLNSLDLKGFRGLNSLDWGVNS